MSSQPQETPNVDPQRALHIGLGVASPLWPAFTAAAAGGLAFWWWNKLARGERFELLAETPAFAPPPYKPTEAFAAVETIMEAARPAPAAMAGAMTAPMGAMIELIVEAAPTVDAAAQPIHDAVIEVVAPMIAAEPIVETPPEAAEPVLEAAEPVAETVAEALVEAVEVQSEAVFQAVEETAEAVAQVAEEVVEAVAEPAAFEAVIDPVIEAPVVVPVAEPPAEAAKPAVSRLDKSLAAWAATTPKVSAKPAPVAKAAAPVAKPAVKAAAPKAARPSARKPRGKSRKSPAKKG